MKTWLRAFLLLAVATLVGCGTGTSPSRQVGDPSDPSGAESSPKEESESASQEAGIARSDDQQAVAALKQLGVVLKMDDQGNVISATFPEEGAETGFAHLKGLVALRKLALSGVKLTDAELKHLANLNSLEDLDLSWTEVSDADLKHLEGLTKLEKLDLSWSYVTDGGLGHLEKIKGLRKLVLEGADVTEKAVRGLEVALPEVKVRTELVVIPQTEEPDTPTPAPGPIPDAPPAAGLAGQYQQIESEYQQSQSELFASLRAAESDEQRRELAANHPGPKAYAERMMELAKDNPEESVAFDALVWIVNASSGSALVDVQTAAVAQLVENHLEDARLADVCTRLSYAVTKPGETLLRTAAKESPHGEVRGKALFSLAGTLKMKADSVVQFEHMDSETLEQAKHSWGEDYVRELGQQDPDALVKEAETLFEQIAAEYADLELGTSTLGRQAESCLFEIRNLAVGMVAPDIEGEDFDGEIFALSDYRGKVVLLDFWGHW